MKFKIKETGEIKELNIYDGNDINWINDLIGNSGFWLDHNEGDDEEGNHIIKGKDFNWWKEYIDNYTSDEQEAEDLAEELGIDINEVNDRINEALAGINDYDMEHDAKQQAFTEIREERKAIKLAASVMGRKGGSAKSEHKAKSSAENGKKGGRPRLYFYQIDRRNGDDTLDGYEMVKASNCEQALKNYLGDDYNDYEIVKTRVNGNIMLTAHCPEETQNYYEVSKPEQ